MGCSPDLLRVAEGLGLFGGDLSLGKDREEDGSKDCNDCDNDEKLDERKGFLHVFLQENEYHYLAKCFD